MRRHSKGEASAHFKRSTGIRVSAAHPVPCFIFFTSPRIPTLRYQAEA